MLLTYCFIKNVDEPARRRETHRQHRLRRQVRGLIIGFQKCLPFTSTTKIILPTRKTSITLKTITITTKVITNWAKVKRRFVKRRTKRTWKISTEEVELTRLCSTSKEKTIARNRHRLKQQSIRNMITKKLPTESNGYEFFLYFFKKHFLITDCLILYNSLLGNHWEKRRRLR